MMKPEDVPPLVTIPYTQYMALLAARDRTNAERDAYVANVLKGVDEAAERIGCAPDSASRKILRLLTQALGTVP